MGKLDMQEVYYGCFRTTDGFIIKKAFTRQFRAYLYILRNRCRVDFVNGWLEHGFESREEHFYD